MSQTVYAQLDTTKLTSNPIVLLAQQNVKNVILKLFVEFVLTDISLMELLVSQPVQEPNTDKPQIKLVNLVHLTVRPVPDLVPMNVTLVNLATSYMKTNVS
jgi:hypothetical protein